MATPSFGTEFKWGGFHVAELTKINGIEVTSKFIDITSHDSPDKYTQEIPGQKTAGDVALEGNAQSSDVNGQLAMMTDFNNDTLRTGLIIFPAAIGISWSFPGYVSAIKFGDATTDGIVPFTATIKPFGKPTLLIATSTGLTTPFFALSNSAVIIPAPSGSVFTYTASVLTAIASVVLTPTGTGSQVIKVNGNVVGTGVPSSAIVLGAAGSVTPVTIEVSETGKAPRIYTIYIARA